MQRLRKLKVPFYGPLIKRKTRFASGRVRTAFVPLFPGYVFVCGDDDQRLMAFKSQCVVRTIEAPDRAELVFDLRQVQRLIASDALLAPEARLSSGRKVRIRSGPLAGIEGEVVKRRRKETFVVAVHFLQQGVSFAVGDCETEKIG